MWACPEYSLHLTSMLYFMLKDDNSGNTQRCLEFLNVYPGKYIKMALSNMK